MQQIKELMGVGFETYFLVHEMTFIDKLFTIPKNEPWEGSLFLANVISLICQTSQILSIIQQEKGSPGILILITMNRDKATFS